MILPMMKHIYSPGDSPPNQGNRPLMGEYLREICRVIFSRGPSNPLRTAEEKGDSSWRYERFQDTSIHHALRPALAKMLVILVPLEPPITLKDKCPVHAIPDLYLPPTAPVFPLGTPTWNAHASRLPCQGTTQTRRQTKTNGHTFRSLARAELRTAEEKGASPIEEKGATQTVARGSRSVKRDPPKKG